MDKSTQESPSKVPADPASRVNEDGKREAEDDVVMESVNAKKQKVEEEAAEIKEGEDIVERQVKTLLEEDCSLESERQIEVKTPLLKNGNLVVVLEDESKGLEEDSSAPKKTVAIVGKVGDVSLNKKYESSGNSLSSLEDVVSIKEDVAATRNSPSAPINSVPLTTPKKQNESGGDPEYEERASSEDGIGDLKQAPAFAIEKGPVTVLKEQDKSSSNHFDFEGKTGFDEDVCEAEKVSTSSNEDAPVTAAMTKAVSSSGLERGTGDNEEPQDKEIKTFLSGTPDVLKSSSQVAQQGSSGAHGESHDDYVPSKGQEPKKIVSGKSCNSEKASEDESFTKEEENSNITPKKNDSDVETINVPKTEENVEGCSPLVKTDRDVEMTDVPKTQGNVEEGGSPVENTPEAPATPRDQRMSSKIVFVGNLSYSVWQEDVEKFFQASGEIAGIRFAMNADETFKGYGYVEFTSAEAAEKAVRELNGKELLRRRVRLDLAWERRSQMPCGSGKDGRALGQTICVRGFNNDDAEQVRSCLEQHFGSCGEIMKVNVPKDQDGGSKGIAYIDFKDTDTCNQALELNGSNFRGNALLVEKARPRVDHRDGAGGNWGDGRWGGRSGWGFGGRYGSGREFGGRVGGGREFCGSYGGGREFGGRYGGSREFGGRYGGSREFHGSYGGDREFGGRYGGDREFGGRDSGNREFGGRYGGDRGFGGRYSGDRGFGGRYGGDRGFGGRCYGTRQFGGGRGFGGSSEFGGSPGRGFGRSWEFGGGRGRGFDGRGRGTPSEPSVAAAGTGMNTISNDTE